MTDRTVDAVLAELSRRRATDAPTHGGAVLSYVYDSGRPELDRLAGAAAALVQPVNGLDPTVFGSVAACERDLIAFARTAFHGPDAVGTITAGGTESCVLAVLAARDHARVPRGRGTVVAPATAHAAFDKAARLLGVDLVRVPVDPVTTAVDPDRVAAAVDDDTFLIVASAPNYPTGTLDPIGELGAFAADRGLPLHVDACLGGFALAWWPDTPPWDFAVPGVTSVSADFHKYGYAPKGASVILHADRDRHRAGLFATTDWPGYPVVNPTLLGSRSAAGTAAAWAITRHLGADGFAPLVAEIASARDRLIEVIAGLDGLRVVGAPHGPVFAVAADAAAPGGGVDPHRWADAVAAHGFTLQAQPSFTQSDGTVLPPSTHLTITPVTARVVDRLADALTEAARDVRGTAQAAPPEALAALGEAFAAGTLSVDDALALDSASTEAVLVGAGIDPHVDPSTAADGLDLSAVLAAVEVLPRAVTAKMLAEFLAAYTDPTP